MDFDKPKVYGDTFIADGLVLVQKMSANSAESVLSLTTLPSNCLNLKPAAAKGKSRALAD